MHQVFARDHAQQMTVVCHRYLVHVGLVHFLDQGQHIFVGLCPKEHIRWRHDLAGGQFAPSISTYSFEIM